MPKNKEDKPDIATAKQSDLRPFVLVRKEDESGVSGEGVVAEGVEFSNGQVALHWLSQIEAITVYANIRCVETLHGHSSNTEIVFLNEE